MGHIDLDCKQKSEANDFLKVAFAFFQEAAERKIILWGSKYVKIKLVPLQYARSQCDSD